MQLNLVNINEYLSGTPTKKRVRYATPTYKKVYKNDVVNDKTLNDLRTWGRIKELYSTLANFFPFPLFNTNEYHDFGMIRTWRTEYNKEAYTHNKQIFKGQEFTVTEAEIIGTEDLSIDERLYLHELLLERLENNETEPTKGIDNMIERLKRGDTLCQLKNSLQI